MLEKIRGMNVENAVALLKILYRFETSVMEKISQKTDADTGGNQMSPGLPSNAEEAFYTLYAKRVVAAISDGKSSFDKILPAELDGLMEELFPTGKEREKCAGMIETSMNMLTSTMDCSIDTAAKWLDFVLLKDAQRTGPIGEVLSLLNIETYYDFLRAHWSKEEWIKKSMGMKDILTDPDFMWKLLKPMFEATGINTEGIREHLPMMIEEIKGGYLPALRRNIEIAASFIWAEKTQEN